MNTFSVNSLKTLDISADEFVKKHILRLEFLNKPESAKRGERLHAMISYYIKGFDTKKIEASLNADEKALFDQIKALDFFKEKGKFIKSEEAFLVKCQSGGRDFYLTGRFDAIYKDKDNYIIYDWKSKNLPKDPESDLQSVVYLYCASKKFNTTNVALKYFSLKNKKTAVVEFDNENTYYKRILNIVEKLPKKYLT